MRIRVFEAIARAWRERERRKQDRLLEQVHCLEQLIRDIEMKAHSFCFCKSERIQYAQMAAEMRSTLYGLYKKMGKPAPQM